MFFAFLISLIRCNELPIYTVNEIKEEVKNIDSSTGYYCYVVNNTEIEDLNYLFFVFKLMVVDMKIITVKNAKFCIVEDENVISPVLRVYKQKMKNMDYPIPDTETMIKTWGDQSFGGFKIAETARRYINGFIGMKSELRKLYDKKQTEEVQQEIKKKEERLINHKSQTLKYVQSLFETRETQRQHIKDYLESEGTDEQKHRYKSILGYDSDGEEENESEDEFDDQEYYSYENNNNKDKQQNNQNKKNKNKNDYNQIVDSNEFEDDAVNNDNDKYFEDMFIKNQEKKFMDELNKAKNNYE